MMLLHTGMDVVKSAEIVPLVQNPFYDWCKISPRIKLYGLSCANIYASGRCGGISGEVRRKNNTIAEQVMMSKLDLKMADWNGFYLRAIPTRVYAGNSLEGSDTPNVCNAGTRSVSR